MTKVLRALLAATATAIAIATTTAAAGPADAPDTGWPAYGGDAGGTRYSTLTQINPANVHTLRVAWTLRTGELGQGVRDWKRSAFEATPVLHGGLLYLTTASTDVLAVDAATGVLRWRHASQSRKDRHYSDGVSRGVSLWVDDAAPAGAACRVRVFAPTLDARLLALDAATGAPCQDFGNQGAVNLLDGIQPGDAPDSDWRNYLVTSPPAILDGKVIVGSSIGDNRAAQVELGTVRAFDARSGALVWGWDPIPRDPSNPVFKDWPAGSSKTASAANAWAPLAVDAQRQLVFVPTGSASPDFFGGLRPGDNRWANSVVALDGRTGQLRWGQQLVHHDLWDYDVPAQPTLVDLVQHGKAVPAVVQATKTGHLFTFHRDTGAPLFAIEERPVPQHAVPGERPSPTQPYPVAPPALVRQGPVLPDDAWGLTWFDARACRQRIEGYRSTGMFQPPSLQDSLMQPGNAGGSNWGGIAFDPQRQLVLANTVDLPFVVALVPRDQMAAQRADPRYAGFEFAQQHGTPYGMRRRAFLSPLGMPCVKPPWGTLTAVDMVRGRIRWRVPLGQLPYLGLKLGMPGFGGPIVTASGLVFIAASLDDRLRAFDTGTGKALWQAKLPAGGYKGASTRGDYLVAYALPQP